MEEGRSTHCANEPSHLKETFVVLEPCSILNTSEVTVSIIVQDRRDFRRPNVWVVKVPGSSSSSLLDTVAGWKKGLLGDRVDLRDFARVQKCICGTTVGGADIESENKLPRGAAIR